MIVIGVDKRAPVLYLLSHPPTPLLSTTRKSSRCASLFRLWLPLCGCRCLLPIFYYIILLFNLRLLDLKSTKLLPRRGAPLSTNNEVGKSGSNRIALFIVLSTFCVFGLLHKKEFAQTQICLSRPQYTANAHYNKYLFEEYDIVLL